jgi:hypothetical protein
MRAVRLSVAAAGLAAIVVIPLVFHSVDANAGSPSPMPGGAIKHVLVIDLENENFDSSFGPASPARYLNDVLVPQGQLLTNYYATGHFSTDNYLAQVSGQAPNKVSGNDCITNTTTFASTYTDVTPGTLDPDQARYPGQVDGRGCVYPAAVSTIGNQLDALDSGYAHSLPLTWRQYAEDMGNAPARDFGPPDPLGGTDCAHPATNGTFPNAATATDQYAIRHVPFLFFHSVTDDAAYCAQHVVPLGTFTTGPDGDVFSGHLAEDLAQARTTPAFSMVTPNVCNDGHDATCVGPNAEGGHAGSLAAADLWLKHWMPLILNSPAYRAGQMLVVVTFDEAGRDNSACCNEQPGPDNDNPGYPPLAALFTGNPVPTAPGQYPGGGRVGAVLLNSKWIQPDSVNGTPYNHYSALRSYEDLLGISSGGSDGHGHLGFAGQTGLGAFGSDVFDTQTSKDKN